MHILLESVSATGGFLERSPVRFTRGLNCIIGARGTCKSTLIESIRYCFNVDPDRIEVLRKPSEENAGFDGLLKVTLKGGSVCCAVHDRDEDTAFSIERDIQSDPRIYREGVMEYTDSQLLHQIEIYSQDDLHRIAENEQDRLSLIDRPHRLAIDKRRRDQEEMGTKLTEIGLKIRTGRERADQLRVLTRALPDLCEELRRARESRPESSRELGDQRQLFLMRQATRQAAERGIEARDQAVTALRSSAEPVERMKLALEHVAQCSLPEMTRMNEFLNEAVQLASSLLVGADRLASIDVAAVLADVGQQMEVLNEPYYSLRKQENDVNESLKKEDALKRQIEQLERHQVELAEVEQQLTIALEKRQEYRRTFDRLAGEIFQIRLDEVGRINAEHGTEVILSLHQGAQSAEYARRIQQLLAGSRIKSQDDLARELASVLLPADLIDLVEAGDTRSLASALGRDAGQMSRLLTALQDNPDLYQIDGHIFEDRLSITMYDDGEPKSVETLSKGQKATALLPLILRPSPYPLIFDQPEDDLDNRFVFHSLVQRIQELKTERQLIFVTHNANIPVIGEAENIVVMRMDSPTKAGPPHQGSVDECKQEIVDLLEGGAEAFIERQHRYGELLTPETNANAT